MTTTSDVSTRRRVKLYMLNDERQWDDKGTGHVSATFVDQSAMALVVISETDGSHLLESKIQHDTAYQKQQETLIVWSEGDNMDLALSFQEKTGCDDIWEKICNVQGKDPSVEITQDLIDDTDDTEDMEMETTPGGSNQGFEFPQCDMKMCSNFPNFCVCKVHNDGSLCTEFMARYYGRTKHVEVYACPSCKYGTETTFLEMNADHLDKFDPEIPKSVILKKRQPEILEHIEVEDLKTKVMRLVKENNLLFTNREIFDLGSYEQKLELFGMPEDDEEEVEEEEVAVTVVMPQTAAAPMSSTKRPIFDSPSFPTGYLHQTKRMHYDIRDDYLNRFK